MTAADLAVLTGQGPFHGRVRLLDLQQPRPTALDYAVALPVQNEEGYLPRTLAALLETIRTAPQTGGLIAVVNNSSDASTRLLGDWGRANDVPLYLAEVEFAPAIRNAPHARRLALDMAARLAPGGLLMTTDADTRVHRDWAARMLALWEGGARLVWEDIRLDDAELATLPRRVREVGEAERAYFAASNRLWQRWTDAAGAPFATRASGASLAICAATYHQIGGLPTPAVGEDKALARLVLEHGYPIGELVGGGTVTSGRFDGRADNGCATALRERATDPDPACDEALIPVSALRQRARLWNAAPPGKDRYRWFTERLRGEPDLSGPRMRYSDVLRELSIATAILARDDRPGKETLHDVA